MPPYKVFNRTEHANAQIIGYRATKDRNWLMLIGLELSTTMRIQGVLQVYNCQREMSQPIIDSTAAVFVEDVTLRGRTEPSKLFSFVQHSEQGCKVIACSFLCF